MKKIIFSVIAAIAFTSAFAHPPVTDKVLKIFGETFPTVKDAKWIESAEYYEAFFESEGVKCRIKYDPDGRILGTTRYYGANEVAPFLKAKLAQKYPGKTIFGVTEVNSENELSFHFVLQDAKQWTHVKSDALGLMSVTDKFNKADSK